MLTVLIEDNGIFSDISLDAENYLRDTISFSFISGEDALYVGYYKPINSLYVDFYTPESGGLSTTVSYYNGNSFSDVDDLVDRTRGLARNGFISWSRDLTTDTATTINGVEQFWYRITLSGDTSPIVFNGINLLLSYDDDLLENEPDILNASYYPEGYTSYLPYHVAARNKILSDMRVKGKRIEGEEYKQLDQWDLLDYEEFRESSKFYVLSQIYFYLSDSVDDKYFQKYEDYKSRHEQAFNLYYSSIDTDDDGQTDRHEKVQSNTALIRRV